MDSWLAIRTPSGCILNLNDCWEFSQKDLQEIAALVGPVDVFLTQYSYAAWAGNPGDHAAHRYHAEQKVNQIRQQIAAFQPRWVIPFASYVYFSHAENHYMNCCVNRIGQIRELVEGQLKTPAVVLYPGESWRIGEQHDSGASVAKYESDFEADLKRPPDTSQPASIAKLSQAFEAFVQKANRRNNRALLWLLPATTCQLSDTGQRLELSFRRGLVETANEPDIELSSNSLWYCMAFDWGGGTLAVNGRYSVPSGKSARNFFWMFRVAEYNSGGISLNFHLLTRRAAARLFKIFKTPQATPQGMRRLPSS